MKKLLLLTTGGTIASAGSSGGLRPLLSSHELLRLCPGIESRAEMDTLELMSLDSSNIQPEEWQLIARAVFSSLDDYDGVVITHGTDTMAYTASMLSYMLRGLNRPVVLTGAQRPIDRPLSDAGRNLETAVAAALAGVRGVTIAFGDSLICGCRAVKVRTMGFDAFESIGLPPLARVRADGLQLLPDTRGGLWLEPAASAELLDELCTDVFLLKLFPGTSPAILEKLPLLGIRALVLETFGAGGLHFLRRDLLPGLRGLIDSGVAVVACSQCLYEPSEFSLYETGRRLLDCGVIPGRDMTTEAIVTKLMWSLGRPNADISTVRRSFETNYAGEMHHTAWQDGTAGN